MIYFLDFTLFYEMDRQGTWVGYAFNNQTKLESKQANSLNELTNLLEYNILCYYCRSDMGASYIVDKEWVLRFCNVPCEQFSDSINRANIDYGFDGTVFADGKYNGRTAQFRVNIKRFKHYSLCKIIGVYTEPNLLSIG